MRMKKVKEKQEDALVNINKINLAQHRDELQ